MIYRSRFRTRLRGGKELLAAALLAGAAALTAGCGAAHSPNHRLKAHAGNDTNIARILLERAAQEAVHARGSRPLNEATSVRIHITEYSADIFNPGSAYAFTLLGTTLRTTTVTDQSAAEISDTYLPLHFANAASAAAWRFSRTPNPIRTGPTGKRRRIPAGIFGFLPQGPPLTYAEVMRLPSVAGVIANVVRAHTEPRSRTAALLLRQYAFLLGTAPVSAAVRAAILRAMANLPGIALCAPAKARFADVCLTEGSDRYEVVIDIQHGTLVAVVQRLMAASPLFPTVAPGSVVERDAFRILPQHG